MKKLFVTLALLVGIQASLFTLETPQTPDINLETQRIEETIAALKAKHGTTEKLLGKNSDMKIKNLLADLDKKIHALKSSLTDTQRNVIIQEINTIKKQIEAVSSK